MTLEKQYAALAKVMGIGRLHSPRPASFYTVWQRPLANYVDKHGSYLTEAQLPNFNSLDVLHEVVMKQSASVRDMINLKLISITEGNFDCSEAHDLDASINATAAQRREAILRTLGLWSDE